MTQKDYVKERISFLKLAMTGIVGAMFALGVYNLQSSGTNFINVMGALIVLGIFFTILGRQYKKLLNELRDLP